MVNEVEKIAGRRRGGSIIHDGNGYYYMIRNKGIHTLHLSCASRKCYVSASTRTNDEGRVQVQILRGVHNHGPNKTFVDLQRLRRRMIERAATETSKIRQIFNEETARVSTEVAAQITFQSIRKTLDRSRAAGHITLGIQINKEYGIKDNDSSCIDVGSNDVNSIGEVTVDGSMNEAVDHTNDTQTGVNIESLCRLCMSESITENLVTIYGGILLGSGNVTIETALRSCVKIKISRSDKLPKNICKDCVNKLEHFWTFQQQCVKCDTIMHKLNLGSKESSDLRNTCVNESMNIRDAVNIGSSTNGNAVINNGRNCEGTNDSDGDSLHPEKRLQETAVNDEECVDLSRVLTLSNSYETFQDLDFLKVGRIEEVIAENPYSYRFRKEDELTSQKKRKKKHNSIKVAHTRYKTCNVCKDQMPISEFAGHRLKHR